jgi:hypothetical protein
MRGGDYRAAPAGASRVADPGAYHQADEEQLANVSPTRTRARELDQACADAVDLARAAAEELAGAGQAGAYAGAEADGDRLVTHLFSCLDPAYSGWRWAVTVARASRSKIVTVDECVLVPGPDSLLAPAWVPWSERVRPGDVGVGDLMPAPADDDRLVPTAALEGDDGVLDWDGSQGWDAGTDLAVSLGLDEVPGAEAREGGRARVLSAIGRDAAAIRWYGGDHGPGAPIAHAAPGQCETCGFLVRLGGPLGRIFGACANEYAPDDGRVVSLDHGCGAHSEASGTSPSAGAQVPVIDELGYDLMDTAGVSLADTVFESLDRGPAADPGLADSADEDEDEDEDDAWWAGAAACCAAMAGPIDAAAAPPAAAARMAAATLTRFTASPDAHETRPAGGRERAAVFR